MKQKTHAEFIEQIKHRPITALTEYEKSSVKMRFQCAIDGHIWEARPDNILAGKGCPVCGIKAITKENTIISDDGTTLEIDVSTKTHKDAVMLIDKADYTSIKESHNGRIYPSKNRQDGIKYAAIHAHGKTIRIHRLITNFDIVDHKNGNGLDNRQSNLRVCTRSENGINSKVSKNNSTGITGVSINKQNGRYIAKITIDNMSKHIGTFLTLESATKARRDAEIEYYGEFAPNNTGVMK